jgi:hypothetical protein
MYSSTRKLRPVFPDLVDLADERVIKRRRNQRLTPEAQTRLRILLGVGRQHLDRDAPLEQRVVGEVHLAHAALAE